MATKQTTPAPTTPVVEPVATPAPVADISEALVQDSAIAGLLNTLPKKKSAKVEPVAAPVAAVVEPVATAPVVEPAAPAPKPLKVRKAQPPKPTMDAQTIADAVAAGVSKVMPKPAEPSPEVVVLPEHLSANKPVYDQLESVNAKYKGIAKKMADGFAKETAYADQWEAQERARLRAEGKEAEAQEVSYNGADPQHAKVLERIYPQIDPRDLKRAEVRAELDEIRKTESNGKPDEVATLKGEIANLKAAPEAEKSVHQFGGNLIQALNPEVEPSRDAYQKWSEANPIESEVAAELQQQIAPVVHAASLLWDGAIAQVDPNNEAHMAAAQMFNGLEQALSSRSEPVENERGQSWLPFAEYNRLPKSEKAEHFTTTKQALVNWIALNTAQEVRNRAKNQRAIIEKNAQRLGYQKAQASPVTPQPVASTPSKPATPLVSPSVSGAAPIPATTGVAPTPRVEGGSSVGGLLGVG